MKKNPTHQSTIIILSFPLSLLPLVIRPPPWMSPNLYENNHQISNVILYEYQTTKYPSIGEIAAWQISSHATLQLVRGAANGVSRVAIIRAAAMETDVVRRRDEERPEDVADGHVVYFRGHVQDAADYGHRPPEAEHSEKSEAVDEYFKFLNRKSDDMLVLK